MPFELDLGQAWQELTGLPFVFGVWAVRRDFAEAHPAATATLHRLLLRSRDWGLGSLAELSRIAAALLQHDPGPDSGVFSSAQFFPGARNTRKAWPPSSITCITWGNWPEEPELEYFKQ